MRSQNKTLKVRAVEAKATIARLEGEVDDYNKRFRRIGDRCEGLDNHCGELQVEVEALQQKVETRENAMRRWALSTTELSHIKDREASGE